MSHIRSARRGALLALAAVLAAAPVRALAGPPPAVAADNAALGAERVRLRAQLDRVNAEIDALKKAARGVGDDYRLRAKMADAEALARQLIDIEARLGLRAPAAKPGPLPIAAPTDSPSDLEAKADIVADQSRRVRAEAEALDRRVTDLKERQVLRRRAADLERDPFAPLEGSKRRMVITLPATADPSNGSRLTASPPPGLSTGTTSNTDRPVTNGQAALSPSGTSAGAGTSPPTPVAMAPPTALSTELRDLLDPATVADIRRLEGTRTPGRSIQALERAVAALRARADALDSEARTMRNSARTTR